MRFLTQVEKERRRERDHRTARPRTARGRDGDERSPARVRSCRFCLCQSNGERPLARHRPCDLTVVAGTERNCVQCISIYTRGCHSDTSGRSRRRDLSRATLRPSRSFTRSARFPPSSCRRPVPGRLQAYLVARCRKVCEQERDGQRTRAFVFHRVAVSVLPFNFHLSLFFPPASRCTHLLPFRVHEV